MTELTEEQIQKRIAEIHGFTKINKRFVRKWTQNRDAIIEAVLRLPEEKQFEFISKLVPARCLGGQGFLDYADAFSLVTTSPLDMARAFAAIHV